MDIISHINLNFPEGKQIQTNEEHSKGVASLAKKFASEFGMGEWGYAMGILHDKGKEQQAFQDYIRIINGISATPLNGRDKSHAYVGALLAKELYGRLSEFMVNQIAGHHAGLYDYTELGQIMTKNIPSDVSSVSEKTALNLEKLKSISDVSCVNHFYRMLYSCLVDADWLDTERFMNPESFESRQNKTSLSDIKRRLDAKIQGFMSAPDTQVNRIRRQVQEECFKASVLP